MRHAFDRHAPKKPTNVSINSDLLKKARELNINLSAALETALAEQLRSHQRAQWLRDNSDAIQAYNRAVESDGSFSDTVRKF